MKNKNRIIGIQYYLTIAGIGMAMLALFNQSAFGGDYWWNNGTPWKVDEKSGIRVHAYEDIWQEILLELEAERKKIEDDVYGMPNPDENGGDGLEGKDIKETVELLIKLLSGGGTAEEISIWESILGKMLAEQGRGPVNYWQPWDGEGFNPGQNAGNPDDGDYVDAATLVKLAKEAGGQLFPVGTEEGPAWGYNGDSPQDWANNHSGGGAKKDPNDHDSDYKPGSTDDGSVKGPPEIVDPAWSIQH